MAGKILIVDDEDGLRKMLGRIIALEGFEVHEATDLKGSRKLMSLQAIDVLLCDVKLPDGNGVDYVAEVKRDYPSCEVILLTAYGNIPDGVLAVKNGAFDYITKGNDNDRLIPLLYQAYDRVVKTKTSAAKINRTGSVGFGDILGKSVLVNNARKLAEKIAPTDASVLLLGETGTGKEIFAKAIHNASKRSAAAFVAVNCSSFSKELLESELFGHKAGAYTGAVNDKKGLFEIADGGTLLLDEIGELPTDLQAKLLRVLEAGEFIKLGDTKVTRVSVRILAATNKDLQNESDEGRFRSDLYYRLNVFSIQLPSLRERLEDIPALSEHFLAVYSAREKKPQPHISPEVARLMRAYSWNGNIRELRNVLERAVILADAGVILPEHIPYSLQKQDAGSAHLSLAAVEKQHIRKVLEYVGGNKTRAAELLHIGLTTLYRKIEEYRIGQSPKP